MTQLTNFETDLLSNVLIAVCLVKFLASHQEHQVPPEEVQGEKTEEGSWKTGGTSE